MFSSLLLRGLNGAWLALLRACFFEDGFRLFLWRGTGAGAIFHFR